MYFSTRWAYSFQLESLALADAVGGDRLGVLAVDLDVAELEVRDEHAVVEHPATDTRPERDHDHGAHAVPSGAEPDLGQPRRVGVVEDDGRRVQPLAEQRFGVRCRPIAC